MKSRIMLSVAIIVLAAGSALAGGTTGAAADPTGGFEIFGFVTAFTANSGSGMPVLTVEDSTGATYEVGLGPLWFLQTAGFSVMDGDEVRLYVFPCDICAATYVAAWVENITGGSYVELRDDDARPLWPNRRQNRGGSARPGQGSGSGNGGSGGGTGSGSGSGQPGGSGSGSGTGPGEPGGVGGLDMSQVATVTGEVVDFTGYAGQGQPTLTLVSEGDTYMITISPHQPIVAAGLIIEPGLVLTVTFAPTECEGEPHLVTIAVTDVATGLTIQLRDPETGFPMAPGGGHNRPNWP